MVVCTESTCPQVHRGHVLLLQRCRGIGSPALFISFWPYKIRLLVGELLLFARLQNWCVCATCIASAAFFQHNLSFLLFTVTVTFRFKAFFEPW